MGEVGYLGSQAPQPRVEKPRKIAMTTIINLHELENDLREAILTEMKLTGRSLKAEVKRRLRLSLDLSPTTPISTFPDLSPPTHPSTPTHSEPESPQLTCAASEGAD